MRFGIIGAGMIAHFHAKAIAAMPGAELAAVYARRTEAAQSLTHEYGGNAYNDLDAFLRHDGLDIATICTPSGAHLEPVVAAARAGKHIICEKPLAMNTAEGEEMCAAVEKAGSAKLAPVITIANKSERNEATDAVTAEILAELCGTKDEPGEFAGQNSMVKEAVRSLNKKLMRARVVNEGVRMDGRGVADLRAISVASRQMAGHQEAGWQRHYMRGEKSKYFFFNRYILP